MDNKMVVFYVYLVVRRSVSAVLDFVNKCTRQIHNQDGFLGFVKHPLLRGFRQDYLSTVRIAHS